MRFVFFVPRYHTNLHYQIAALQAHQHEVSVFALYEGASEGHDATQPEILGYSAIFRGINRILNPEGGKLIKNSFELKYGFPPITHVWRALRTSKADVCVVKNIESVYSILVFALAFILRKRIVVLLQIPKYRKVRKSRSVALLGFFGISVVTPVQGDATFANDNNSLFYIPFPIDATPFEREYCPDGVTRILCVGKFQERKDQLLLLKAVNTLKETYQLHVTLVGQDDEEAYKKELHDYVQEHHLEPLVTFESHRPWQDMENLYRSHDLFVLPSYDESASFAVVEAMAAQLAVVSSDDNGTACYIHEGENGYVFKHRDLDDLIRVLRELVGDTERLAYFGKRSLEIVLRDHSLERFYEQFMHVVNI